MGKVTVMLTVAGFVITSTMGSHYVAAANSAAGRQLLARGDTLYRADEADSAKTIYALAAEKAETDADTSVLVEAYSQVARCYLDLDRIDEGRPSLDKAGKLASDKDPLGWSRYLEVKGLFEKADAAALKGAMSPMTEKAPGTFSEMYDYCLGHGLYEKAVDAAIMASQSVPKTEKTSWYLKGIDAAEKGKLNKLSASLLDSLGWAYDDAGKYSDSFKTFKKARAYHYAEADELSMINADLAVGHSLRMMGKIDTAEVVLSNAQRWALLLKSEKNNKPTALCLGMAFMEMGEIFLKKNDVSRALDNFKAAYSNLSQAGWDRGKLHDLDKRIREVSATR